MPLRMTTYSNPLFIVVVKYSTTTERRLSIDLRAVTESYQRKEISDIGSMHSPYNPVDALAKIKSNSWLDRAINDNTL